MALRIRKKLFHHTFCSHPVYLSGNYISDNKNVLLLFTKCFFFFFHAQTKIVETDFLVTFLVTFLTAKVGFHSSL